KFLARDMCELGKRFAESLEFRHVPLVARQHTDASCPLLLRTRRDRPRNRAAEQRDELAPFQLIELHLLPASWARIAGYRIGEDQSGDIGTILQPVPA